MLTTPEGGNKSTQMKEKISRAEKLLSQILKSTSWMCTVVLEKSRAALSQLFSNYENSHRIFSKIISPSIGRFSSMHSFSFVL
jgi:hypothetical protein